MALTIGNSPLAQSPGGKFNFESERLPQHLLYLEDFQKRIRGQLAGKTIVDSRRGKLLHETGKLPQWYVPKEDVEPRALEPSERRQEHLIPSEARLTTERIRTRARRRRLFGAAE
jgi:Domain of unknown function (DUF427)